MILVMMLKKESSLFLLMLMIQLISHHPSVLSEARRLCSKLSRAILLTVPLRITLLDNIGLLHEIAPAKLMCQMNLFLFQTLFTQPSGWNAVNLHNLAEKRIGVLLFLPLIGNLHRRVLKSHPKTDLFRLKIKPVGRLISLLKPRLRLCATICLK